MGNKEKVLRLSSLLTLALFVQPACSDSGEQTLPPITRSAEASPIEPEQKAILKAQAKPEDIIKTVEIRSAPAVQNTPIVIEQYKSPVLTFDEIKILYGREYPTGIPDKDRSEGVYYWSASDEKVVMVWGKVKDIKEVKKTTPISDGFTMTSTDQVVTLKFGKNKITVPIKDSGAWTAKVVDWHIEDASSAPVSPEQVAKEIKAAGEEPMVDARLDFTNGSPVISYVGVYTPPSSR